jgi:ribosomal protein S18 acetylase RimI-like enzyme
LTGEESRPGAAQRFPTSRLTLVPLGLETLRTLVRGDRQAASEAPGLTIPAVFSWGRKTFHGPPEAVGRAEINYTVFADHRGRGYATEAAAALVNWASAQGWPTVFASIAPDNKAPLALVWRLGFVHTGTQLDEIDGIELVFESRWACGLSISSTPK